MRKARKSEGVADPQLLRVGGIALAVVLLGTSAVWVVKDRQSQSAYQEWARAENKKVFEQSTQQRLSDQQLRSLSRQLNDSFYQRLQDQLPVRILVIGDSYAGDIDAGAASKSWAQLLKAQLSVQYGVTVELTNLTLPEGNGSFAAWAALMEQPNGAASAMLREMQAAGTASVAEDGTIAAEGWDNTKSHAFRKNEYDLAIVSLGTTDDPEEFPTWYEAVLRALRTKYRQCSVISLLSDQAVIDPSLGYADENEEKLRTIAAQYHADVVDIGAMLQDKDANAGDGAAAAEGISEAVLKKYTSDGLYLSAAGHTLLAETLEGFIEQKAAAGQSYSFGDIALLTPSVEALDEFHFVDREALNRIDDYTYVLGKNQMQEDANGAESIVRHGRDTNSFRGIVGVDYTLVSGDNDLYLATGDGTHPFGRRTLTNDTGSRRSIAAINDGFDAERDGNLIISFGTKEQADGLKGVIFSGELSLPARLDDFKAVSYVGPTDGNGNRLSLDKDGKVVKSEAKKESNTAKESIAESKKPEAMESVNAAETEASTQTAYPAVEESAAAVADTAKATAESTKAAENGESTKTAETTKAVESTKTAETTAAAETADVKSGAQETATAASSAAEKAETTAAETTKAAETTAAETTAAAAKESNVLILSVSES